MPQVQGAGRIDNPDHYRVLYGADSPVAAFAEAFGSKPRWRDEMFGSSRLPEARRSLVTFETDPSILDLDDARALVRRRLRPSGVATPERSVTQAWALAAFEERSWDGIRWWSVRDARWGVYGLWSLDATVISVEPLTLQHPIAVEAAEMLRRVL